MKSYFGDASYYIALVNRDDVSHEKAVALTRSLRLPVVTTVFVLAEVADALSQPRNRRLAVDLIRDLQNDPSVTILSDDRSLFAEGFELFIRRPDKAWSLTDCISFTVMSRMELAEALTADRDFEQGGFVAVLK